MDELINKPFSIIKRLLLFLFDRNSWKFDSPFILFNVKQFLYVYTRKHVDTI